MLEKIKAEVMKQFNAGFLAVTSYPQWVVVIRWQNQTVNTGLHFLFAKCHGKQESPPSFILSNKERKKSTEKFPFRDILSTGGRL